ncbi:16S rRNA (cytosine(1402)-N(4))-methyltransferase RsmH [Bacillus horti]|uniref:Ribosomal RNA small subunit methyltransferase H n=1 Tax=Caldalkalibacillus horti TaxID=77523 RepID=A0ABT9VUP3_9BACI|nr:16S rRNA (cytosine(1402)-N(4))-methyltransferase RsmH [Bacillus horti]MDQ0164599.1 16S rRNA (cytosine1402-N4)-methyltransferase [Bacillus horti]
MFDHITVLRDEAVQGLNIKPDGTYVDCTLGGAGHSALIASKLNNNGRLICIDQDELALGHAKERLAAYKDQVLFVKSNFRYITEILSNLSIEKVDGFLYDLGVSSPQLDEAERGFSYNHNASLDMRMDRSQVLTAHEIVNSWSEADIATIIYRYGEERFSRRIAHKIVEARSSAPIATTFELVELIKAAIPAPARRQGPHPAKRTFQAIRIAVNDELKAFEDSLDQAVSSLNKDGRVSVITFHSLEDRICKQYFQQQSQGCVCPPDFPQCVCNQEPNLKVITRKPILPSEQELEENPRARSAKLRVAEKINK